MFQQRRQRSLKIIPTRLPPRPLALLIIVASGFILAAPPSPGAEADWNLRRDRDGIQVFTRAVSGSPYNAVRVVTELDNVRLSALVALIEDFERCSEWADRCEESRLVRRISDRELIVYTHNNMPFPVRDRDAVTRSVWSQNPDTLDVTMTSVAVPGEMDEIRGRLRLREVDVRWYFTVLPGGRVRVANEAHIDPGSPLPGWVTNMLLVDTPFETFRGLVREVREPRYANAEVGFIVEP